MQFGRYHVVRMVGQGGTSTVYEAVDPRLNQRVAIKALHASLASSPELVARFEVEARIVNGIHHPGIVAIYDLARLRDGAVYHVMEFLEGETLAHRLARRSQSRLDLDEIYRLARQIIDTLCAVHVHGIVHRDLKPDNLMLVADACVPGGVRVKILDFGVAKILNLNDKPHALDTKAGIGLGTIDYIAPEQILDARHANDRADVYALGCILFELATGRKVFIGENNLQILGSHLTRPAPNLLEFAGALPREFAALVNEMLSKEADRRPTMQQVLTRLDALYETWMRQGSQTIVLRPGAIPQLDLLREEADRTQKVRPKRRFKRAIPLLFICATAACLPWLPFLQSCQPSGATPAERGPLEIPSHILPKAAAADWITSRLLSTSH